MARFLRSTGQSRLSKPAVVDAATVFRPISVTTAAVRTSADFLRHRPQSKLQPPASLSTPVVFVAPAIRATLTKANRQQLPPTTKEVRPPAVTGASVVFGPIRVRTARTPTAYNRSRPLLRPPAVVGAAVVAFVARAIAAKLTRTRQQPLTTRLLRPPASVTAPTTFATRVELTRTPQAYYRAKSKLRPPTVLGAVVTFVFRPVQVFLTRTRQQPPTTKKVRPPAVIAPATVFRAVQAKLTTTPQSYYKAKSRLRAPTVTGAVATFVFRPVQVFLTRTRQQPPTTKKLSPPSSAAPAIVFRAVQAKLARTPQRYYTSKSKLRPPTILQFVAQAIRAFLAPQPSPRFRRTASKLRVVIGSSFIARPIRTALANLTRKQTPTPTRSRLRKPAVIASAKIYTTSVYTTYSHAPPATRFIIRQPGLPGKPLLPGTPAKGTVIIGDAVGSLRLVGRMKGSIKIVEE